MVTVEVGGADSLAVRYGLTVSTSPGQLTPAQPVIDTQLVLPIVGLEPETTYRLELVGAPRQGRMRPVAMTPVPAPLSSQLGPADRAGFGFRAQRIQSRYAPGVRDR